MTNEEAKQAFMQRISVVCNGIKYERISAIIYRLNESDDVDVYAELLDKCGHSVTIVPINTIDQKEASNE